MQKACSNRHVLFNVLVCELKLACRSVVEGQAEMSCQPICHEDVRDSHASSQMHLGQKRHIVNEGVTSAYMAEFIDLDHQSCRIPYVCSWLRSTDHHVFRSETLAACTNIMRKHSCMHVWLYWNQFSSGLDANIPA